MPKKERTLVEKIGIVASCAAILMYVSYIPQIYGNLHGEKSDFIQPLAAAINCTLWVFYGALKKPHADIPIIVANLPGVIFGLLAVYTSLFM